MTDVSFASFVIFVYWTLQQEQAISGKSPIMISRIGDKKTSSAYSRLRRRWRVWTRQKELGEILITNSHRTDKHSALKQGLVDTLNRRAQFEDYTYYTRMIVIVKQYDLWIG